MATSLRLPKFRGTVAAGLTDSRVLASTHQVNGVPDTASKHETSNAQRLGALKQRRSEFEARKHVVSEALRKLQNAGQNGSSPNKHIKFRDSSSPEPEPQLKQLTKSIVPEKRLQLFADNNREGSPDNLLPSEEDVLPTPIGNLTNSKFIRMSARLGGDPRFRMDKKFLADFADAEEDDTEVREVDSVEKSRDMSILEKVLNKPLPTSSSNDSKFKKRKLLLDIGSNHYDPENPPHSAVEVSEPATVASEVVESKRKKKKQKAVEQDAEQGTSPVEPPAPNTSKERFYRMNTDFASELKQKLQGADNAQAGPASFSLLDTLGLPKSIVEEPSPANVQQKKAIPIKSWQLSALNMHESSSSEDETEQKTRTNEQNKADFCSDVHSRESFFITSVEDPRIKRAINQFRRTKSLDAIRKQWERLRGGLMKNYKNRAKKARRMAKQTVFVKGRRVRR